MNFTDFIPSGFSREDAFIAMATLTALVVSIAIWQTLVVRDRIGPRLRVLSGKRAALKEAFLAPDEQPESETVDFMRGIVQKMKLLRGRDAEKSTLVLARAGFRTRDSLVVFMFLRLCLPFAFGIVGIMLFHWLNVLKLSNGLNALIIMAMVVIGAYVPHVYVKNLTQKRREKLEKAIADTLDLMVISAEAGLSLDATFSRVARELGPAWPEMSDELTLTAIELTFLSDRRKAMDNLNDRTNMDSIRAVVNTLRQAEKYGTPLAQSLRVLSAEFRNNRMMKAEEKAARLPVLLTLPMVVFILPPLFIVLIGPAILKLIDQLSRI
jgi:tight adherence protein C